MRISDWSSDVCSSDLTQFARQCEHHALALTIELAHAVSAIIAQTLDHTLHQYFRCRGTGSNADALFAMQRSEEHTSELQSVMRISYAVFCLKKKTNQTRGTVTRNHNRAIVKPYPQQVHRHIINTLVVYHT